MGQVESSFLSRWRMKTHLKLNLSRPILPMYIYICVCLSVFKLPGKPKRSGFYLSKYLTYLGLSIHLGTYPVYLHIYVIVYKCIPVKVYIYMYIHMYWMKVHMHIHIIHERMRICTCVYIYMFMHCCAAVLQLLRASARVEKKTQYSLKCTS